MFTFLKRLLSTAPPPAPSGSWQPLQRSASQEHAHQQWVQDQVYLNWMGPFFKAYHYAKAGLPNPQWRVELLQEEGRQGALFFYHPSIGPGNFRHLFDFLRDRVIALGYNLATSDQRSRRHDSYTETVAKHFLKPQPRDCTATGRCNQRFGTIMVDLMSINNQPGFIRIFCNPYDNDIFTPPHSFDELMEALFKLPDAPPEVQKLITKYTKP